MAVISFENTFCLDFQAFPLEERSHLFHKSEGKVAPHCSFACVVNAKVSGFFTFFAPHS